MYGIRSNAVEPETPALANHVVDWQNLVERIKQLDRAADEELYRRIVPGVRMVLLRRGVYPAHLDDAVHDIYIVVITNIREGAIRDANALPGYLQTITARRAASQIGQYATERANGDPEMVLSGLSAPKSACPEQQLQQQETDQIAVDATRRLTARERDVLTRFYCLEQSKDQICRDLGLSETQYRLLKSRAKQRFSAAAQKQLRSRRQRLVMRVFSRLAS